mgnify:CR=1 FL=1
MVFHADGSTEFQWLRRPDILLEVLTQQLGSMCRQQVVLATSLTSGLVVLCIVFCVRGLQAVKDFVTMVFGEGAVRDALSSSSATGRGAVGRDATGAGVGADGASCTPVTSHVASSIDSDDADVTECKVPPPSLAASDATFDNLLRRHTSGSYGIPHTSPSLYRDASDDARYRRWGGPCSDFGLCSLMTEGNMWRACMYFHPADKQLADRADHDPMSQLRRPLRQDCCR